MDLTDDQFMNIANKGLKILVAANQNLNDSVAYERNKLAEIWESNPDLTPVYIGERVNYEPNILLVSLQFVDDQPIFIIGPVNNGMAYVDINQISQMRANYLTHFRFDIGNIEKYDAAISILIGELKQGPDQIYADIPEFTAYRKMMEAGYSWSHDMEMWYK